MGGPSELNAWLMPPVARDEWLTLTALLGELPQEQVPCRAGDPEDWWPDRKRADSPATLAAIEACRRCRARVACADYALSADERFGIWGATLPEDRLEMLSAAKMSPTSRITAAS